MSASSRLTPLLGAMKFRCIGPPRGGRVVAVAGHPEDTAVFYFGAVAGGVWKTEDAGTIWRNVSDGFFATSSVGALTVSESDPSILYAGMGECTIRNDVSSGDGVYRSSDGGNTWVHRGLAETRHISEIRVHPRDPDLVYVAAQGDAFGPNPQRGIYRSRDGGQSWQQILFVSDEVGAADLSMDPRNPQVLYATMWEARRSFWTMSSGGPGSGIWKSTDGGDSWSEISRNPGLPAAGILGKIGVSASAARSGRVWALVEAEPGGGLYRSDDFGDSWTLISDRQDLRYRPWYYMHVFADPVDADTVYVTNLGMWRSSDGGATFSRIPTPHGDNHDLWIDPRDNRRMIEGNDGGANVSFNAGDSWSTLYNQLTAQLYTVTTDNQEPHYRVYGTQQDNSSISVPSGSYHGAITWSDCYCAGTGESGYMAVHPQDPDIVYIGAIGSSPGGGGALQRYDHRSGQIRLVSVWPEAHGGIGAGALRYRFGWTFPILFSPHDSGVLYCGGNAVFRSTDEGHSWSVVSPDLTRNDADKMVASGGPITKDTSGAEHYCTLYTLRESPHEPGVLWTGSDDGLVHLSRDDGQSWVDVTPAGLPEWSFIRAVEPSPHDPATVYLAATRYKLQDLNPYIYRSRDYGASWEKITGAGETAIAAHDHVRVVRCDPSVPGVLYAGTESGLYLSLDDGDSWDPWRSNLPVTPVYDLAVKGSDLVVATHGRSFWIMDDLSPLHQVEAVSAGDSPVLFTPGRTWRLLPDICAAWISTEGKEYWVGLGQPATFLNERDEAGQLERHFLDTGKAAPAGAIVYYRLEKALESGTDASLSFLDEHGALIRAFHPKPAGRDALSDEEKALDPGPWMPGQAGINRFVWDLRYPGVARLKGNRTGEEAERGPLIVPGRYEIQLKVAAAVQSAWVEVVNDPRSPASAEELREQLELLRQVHGTLEALYAGVARLRDVRAQLKGWATRLGGQPEHTQIRDAAGALERALDEIEDELILPGEQRDVVGLNDRMRLNAALASVISIIESADARPTVQARELVAMYTGQIEIQLEKLRAALEDGLQEFNSLVARAKLPAVSTSTG